MTDAAEPLLVVEDLETHYPVTEGLLRREVNRVRAVDGVSLAIERGEALGLVGESGCGKTTTAHTLLHLEEPTAGEIRFDGEPVTELPGAALRAYRRQVQLVVQDPDEAFNPRLQVGRAVAEPLHLYGMTDRQRREDIVADLLERVDLSAADAERFPHEFSSGELQRLAIARALVTNPALIVADEPTSALDGRTKAAVLNLLNRVRREFGVAVLVVSHDIDVVRRFCDRVAVMYLGELLERGPVPGVLDDPAHPYTRALVESVPDLTPGEPPAPPTITDTVPAPADPPDGCRFHPRCAAIIPPEEVDVPSAVWRAVAAMRFRLMAGELPPTLAAADPAAPSTETVRDAFGLPAEVSEERVEAAVNAALELVAAGEWTDAAEKLAVTLPTVCERTTPSTVLTDEGRDIQCHRYDDHQPGCARPWVDDTPEAEDFTGGGTS